MIQYEYTIGHDGRIQRSFKEDFSDRNSIKMLLLNNIKMSNISDKFKSYMKGLSLKDRLIIENEWYENLEAIYRIEDNYKVIEESGIEEEIKNLKELIEYDEENNIISGKILEYINKLSEIENNHKWLRNYYGEKVQDFPEILEKEDKELEKDIIASIRNTEVRSVEDSIADLAKMNSLLFSCISAMYSAMTDTAKGKIDDRTKEIIDYSVEKFKETTTRADNQLMKEGTHLIDKLFDREAKIADIIDSVKG